jgi:hypothetical protein
MVNNSFFDLFLLTFIADQKPERSILIPDLAVQGLKGVDVALTVLLDVADALSGGVCRGNGGHVGDLPFDGGFS